MTPSQLARLKSLHKEGKSDNDSEIVATIYGPRPRSGWTQCWQNVTLLRCQLVSEAEYETAHRRIGSVYLIKNDLDGSIKIGHSLMPTERLQALQTGSSSHLTIIGLIAAKFEVEGHIHEHLAELRLNGEWFDPKVMQYLNGMMKGYLLRRNIWSLLKRQNATTEWNEQEQKHSIHGVPGLR
jgi:hypothetical protein